MPTFIVAAVDIPNEYESLAVAYLRDQILFELLHMRHAHEFGQHVRTKPAHVGTHPAAHRVVQHPMLIPCFRAVPRPVYTQEEEKGEEKEQPPTWSRGRQELQQRRIARIVMLGGCGKDTASARVGLPSIANEIDEGLSMSRELIGMRIVMSLEISSSVHDSLVSGSTFRAGLLLSRRRLRLPLPSLLMEIRPESIESNFILA